MQRVAVAQAGGVFAHTVMIDAAGAIDDLVKTVAIDVADGQGVAALTGIAGVAAAIAVERPSVGQRGAVNRDKIG